MRWARRPILGPGTVYARLSNGWPPEEALGYRPHEDGRGLRPAFRLHGRLYTSLRDAAAWTGIKAATLRSRLDRMLRSGCAGTMPEIGVDRRSCRSEPSRLAIPWPGTGERLTAEAFAARTGVAKATVLHRWHRMQRRLRQGGPPMSPSLLHRWLTATTDRRRPVRLVLPDGRIFSGGERDVVRRVLGDAALEASRRCRLSESGVRRRLRLLTDLDRMDSARVARAFGFTEGEG